MNQAIIQIHKITSLGVYVLSVRVCLYQKKNVCCRSNPCITTTESFEMIVVNQDILSVAIVHCSDVYSEDPEYAPTVYRKAAYRQ